MVENGCTRLKLVENVGKVLNMAEKGENGGK